MMLVALVPHSEVLGKVLLREEALTGFRGWFALDALFTERVTPHLPRPTITQTPDLARLPAVPWLRCTTDRRRPTLVSVFGIGALFTINNTPDGLTTRSRHALRPQPMFHIHHNICHWSPSSRSR